LRCGEAAALRLDDLDWRDGTVTVRGKGNRSDRLPPPVDVGTLVADYPTEGRPDTAARTVFVQARPAAWPNTCAPSGRHSQCCPKPPGPARCRDDADRPTAAARAG
jgi:hypothetical protein